MDYSRYLLASICNFWVSNFSTQDDPVFTGDHFDVAIAIGIGTRWDGKTANGRSGANAIRAALAVENGTADYVLLTGGNGPVNNEGVTEAEGMLIFLRELGLAARISEERILLEQDSHNTKENALCCLNIMQLQDWNSALICTEALHAGRVRSTFRKQWNETGIRFAVIKTYGEYYNSTGNYTQPWSFCLREWLVNKPASKLLRRS